ncbi:MAG: Crp/Fnr family transcriptional regulator [bacterium]|nr:Crp/Fnr family transcriptional regulator [bacterium]
MDNKLKETLRLSSLFSGISDRSLDEITGTTSIKKASRGDMLFYESDPANAFFIVSSGKFKIFKLSADGKEQILRIANPGESFAEAAMFDGANYPASAQALEDGELVMINRERFSAALARNPALALNLLGQLSKLLRQLTRLVEGLSLTDVTSRLAHYFIEQLESGEHSHDLIMHLTERKSVLASQLGTIPETLSRSLAKLSREKIIEVQGARIKILDEARLRDLA